MSGCGGGGGHGHDHSGHGSCDGHDHTPAELGVAYSLYTRIDIDNVECLNEAIEDSGKTVFKPWEERLDREKVSLFHFFYFVILMCMLILYYGLCDYLYTLIHQQTWTFIHAWRWIFIGNFYMYVYIMVFRKM